MSALKHFRESDVLIAASRYYTGRVTASVHPFCQQLAAAWPEIQPSVRAVIRRDLEDDFQHDDDDRAEGREVKRLGHDCDRESWELVRAAWLRLDRN